MSSRTTPKRHTHSPSDIIGGTIKAEQIPPGLFAARTHGHAPTEISGLGDYIRDEVGDALIAGDGVTLTQDSVTGAITIDGFPGLEVRDEGVTRDSVAGVMNFVGAGVAVTTIAGGVQVSVPGGGSALEVRDEGTTLTSAAGFLDFVGAGVAATTVPGGVQVSIPGASGGGGGWSTVVKPTDTSRTSTVVVADDPHLVIPVTGGKSYVIRGLIFVKDLSTVAGFRYAFNAVSIDDVFYHRRHQTIGAAAGTDVEQTVTAADGAYPSGIVGSVGGLGILELDLVLVNVTMTETLKFRWAQGTSSTNPTTVCRGSYLEYREI